MVANGAPGLTAQLRPRRWGLVRNTAQQIRMVAQEVETRAETGWSTMETEDGWVGA